VCVKEIKETTLTIAAKVARPKEDEIAVQFQNLNLDEMQFNYGRHKGKTFKEVALCDPGYHDRYVYVLQKEGKSPYGELAKYISWLRKTTGESINATTTKNGNKRVIYVESAGCTE
jgi:hypothetical protein